MAEIREKRELVLPPGAYAFTQDTTKGGIKVFTGPTVINPSAQEIPVVYNAKTGQFDKVEELELAKQKAVVIVEGYYGVLLNPAKDRKQPEPGPSHSGDLDVGRKIVMPGPSMFSLWPGQVAEVIRGHHLHSNQYLLIRVYNEDEAKKNWSKAVMKPATASTLDTSGMTPEDAAKAKSEFEAKSKEEASKTVSTLPPKDLVVGKLLVIKGTEVSFYIPPTGITVLAEGDASGKMNYVREALTLERLEYAILIDENGQKRYAKGPTVVFPNPTEKFMEGKDDDGKISKKFRAIELNELQGIHIKVIADYEEGTTKFKTGEELFITGKDTAIYYPREEHSAIKYDGKVKHFATAIPVGEGRYVLNRMTGVINKIEGPAMLLPDPRSQVIVRRVLSDKQSSLWYPNNAEALEYNRKLRHILSSAPTTRGAPSEGDVERGTKKGADKNFMMSASVSNAMIADSSRVSKEQGFVGDEFSRASNYTSPRTVTLDTKYQGVPVVDVYTGYCVLVVSKSGERRIEKGPKTILLGYDESFEVLELSTGKPKNTDNLMRTVYLRTENNQVADVIKAETADHVLVEMRLSYWVNFEGEPLNWFSVENYVKFLCDHIRSILKGAIRKVTIGEFYANSTDLLRKYILKEDKAGLSFEANGMRVIDMEVLNVEITDPSIKALLDKTQTDVVRTNIELASLDRQLEVTKAREGISREETGVKAETIIAKTKIEADIATAQLALVLTNLGNKLKTAQEEAATQVAKEAVSNLVQESELARDRKAREQEQELAQVDQNRAIEMLKNEAATIVTRFTAAQGGFSEALLALSNNDTMIKVAEAWSMQRVIGGASVSDALAKVFANTPLSGLVSKMTSNAIIPSNGSAEKRVGSQS